MADAASAQSPINALIFLWCSKRWATYPLVDPQVCPRRILGRDLVAAGSAWPFIAVTVFRLPPVILSERDICSKFITPALRKAGLGRDVADPRGGELHQGSHHRAWQAGQSRQGQARRLHPLLQAEHPDRADRGQGQFHSVGDGMQQGLDYALRRSTSPSYSPRTATASCFTTAPASNAKRSELALNAFPSPAELWARYRAWKGLTPDEEQIVLQDYFDDGSGKAPRYYHVNAVNAAIEAIAKGQDRILLVMATGTGKTYTAFQIIWRLWKAGRKKRILFLADRNVLIDQTMVNDFRPFGACMAKLSTAPRPSSAKTELRSTHHGLDKKRRIDTAYEVYLGLYQAITGPEERQKLFREFSPGFFDLIVIDECHRGSAAEDSAWREILEYFSGATQIGLTATPKETEYVSNIPISATRFTPIR
jgi:type I restriction enzyme R subunit